MYQFRLVNSGVPNQPQLQVRAAFLLLDDDGKVLGRSDWDEWKPVPVVDDPSQILPNVQWGGTPPLPEPVVGEELPLPAKKELMEKFVEAARPLQKWIRENFHPHAKVLIDSHRAELYEVMLSFDTEWKKEGG